MNFNKLILVLILVIAGILRLYDLGNYPPNLTQDEASLGYNAYSILKTGKDEYGEVLPTIFKSFGDYKPGLYVYFTVPFVAFLGLNHWSVRLPSALAGILSVYLVYLIVNLLYRQGLKLFGKERDVQKLSLAVTFVAATSPWLIHFSRGAWESNLALTLTLTGIFFFLKSLSISKFIIPASLAFSFTLITYQGAKLSTTIVVTLLIIIFWKEVRNYFFSAKKFLISSIMIAVLVAAPIVASFFSGQTGRLTVFSIFSYPRPKEYTQAFLDRANEEKNNPAYFIYHSESLHFLRGILGRWSNHFSGKFLFFDGDYQSQRHSSPYHGMMLLVDFILLPLGFIALTRSRSLRTALFIFLWLLFAPIPAALSRDQVHAVRSLNTSIPLVFISGLGLYFIFEIFRSLKINSVRILSFSLLISLYLLAVIYYLDSYFIHFYKHNARGWFYGYSEVIKKVSELRGGYDKVIFQQSYNQPYIYFLFYEKYGPEKFQGEYNFKSGGADVGFIEQLENIDFRFFGWPPMLEGGKTLIVGDSVAIPGTYDKEQFNLIYEVRYRDNSVAYRILETK